MSPLMKPETEAQMRSYAADETSWGALKAKGFTNYLTVLARLHELGLRPPTAPADRQAAGCKALQEILGARPREAPAR